MSTISVEERVEKITDTLNRLGMFIHTQAYDRLNPIAKKRVDRQINLLSTYRSTLRKQLT